MSGVTQERNGWRDEGISRRHREWGVSCSAVDLDFLLLEFNWQEPVALVEYKHKRASMHTMHTGRYAALKNLCDGYHRRVIGGWEHKPLPCLVARYDSDTWSFEVYPMNDVAEKHYAHCSKVWIPEQRFVRSLHLLRGDVLSSKDEAAIRSLNTVVPPRAATA